MTHAPKTRFVDGLRVTPRHLEHLQASLADAVEDLRRALGVGAIAYGLQLTVNGDAVTLSPGTAFSASAMRLAVSVATPLDIPSGAGPFHIFLEAEAGDEEAYRHGDEPTILLSTTSVRVADASPAPADHVVVIGTVSRAGDGTLAVDQPVSLFLPPARHGHTGELIAGPDGVVRYDGAAIAGGGDSVARETPPPLTTVAELAWDLREALVLDDVVSLLNPLRLKFTRKLAPESVERFAHNIVLVTFRPDNPKRAIVALDGEAAVNDGALEWKPRNVDAVHDVLRRVAGTISIEVDCGYLVDDRRNPVSGHPGGVAGVRSPPSPPGGIFRTWISKR